MQGSLARTTGTVAVGPELEPELDQAPDLEPVFDGALLRRAALAGLVSFSGFAGLGALFGLRLAGSGAPIVVAALVCAALWIGSLCLDARRTADRIAQTPRPLYCPARRSAHGTNQAGKHPVVPGAVKMIAGKVAETVAEYPGRRGEDKVFFLLRAATVYRSALITLLVVAVVIGLRSLVA